MASDGEKLLGFGVAMVGGYALYRAISGKARAGLSGAFGYNVAAGSASVTFTGTVGGGGTGLSTAQVTLYTFVLSSNGTEQAAGRQVMTGITVAPGGTKQITLTAPVSATVSGQVVATAALQDSSGFGIASVNSPSLGTFSAGPATIGGTFSYSG